jgi:predicted O-methyltransferase YrrM
MNPNELEILCALFKDVAPKTVVEFGINAGRTAKALLREVPTIERYIGIDVLPGYTTDKKVQRNEVPQKAGALVSGDERVELIVTEKGSHGLTDLPPCDAVFIDGDHGRFGVEHDSDLAFRAVRPGGIIVWHDYHDLGTVDVRDVLHELRAKGHDIISVEGTWLAFERV